MMDFMTVTQINREKEKCNEETDVIISYKESYEFWIT